MAFTAWSALILAGTLLFTFSLVPQVVRTLQLRRAEHLSAVFIIMVIAASACNMTYFVHLEEWIAASGFVFNIIAWAVVLYYRFNPGEPRTDRPIGLLQPKD